MGIPLGACPAAGIPRVPAHLPSQASGLPQGAHPFRAQACELGERWAGPLRPQRPPPVGSTVPAPRGHFPEQTCTLLGDPSARVLALPAQGLASPGIPGPRRALRAALGRAWLGSGNLTWTNNSLHGDRSSR